MTTADLITDIALALTMVQYLGEMNAKIYSAYASILDVRQKRGASVLLLLAFLRTAGAPVCYTLELAHHLHFL